jgi:two-component system, OmpR family, response regulator
VACRWTSFYSHSDLLTFQNNVVRRAAIFGPPRLPGKRQVLMRVLLIEDDPMIGQGLSKALAAEGMSVDWVRNGADASGALADGAHAIILLDLGLPDAEGFDLLKAARRNGLNAPVLVITARDGLDDRVSGLDIGADDYLVKPFELRELLARMRAVLRRHQGRATSRIISGESELDPETHELSHRNIVQILPAREYALMHAIMERPGRILSRAQIEERIYGWGEEVESNAVDVLIHSIRQKFGKDIVFNVRGAGWMSPKSRS